MKILLVSGSWRHSSFNTQIALMAQKILEQMGHETNLLDYQNVPFFNQDEEVPMKGVIKDARMAFNWADGIWFFTPEYNGMIPGVLKNLLDWMSRSAIPGDFKTTALYGKCACISGAAGRMAAAGSREQLATLLKRCGMKVYPESVGFALTGEEMKTNKLTDPDEIKTKLQSQAEGFISWLEEKDQFKGSPLASFFF